MYELINGKIYRTSKTEVTHEELLRLLNGAPVEAVTEPKKLAFEDFDLGKPTSPNVRIGGTDEKVKDGTPCAWKNEWGEWLYNWWGALEECKHLGKRMPTDEEFTELLKVKEDMPNAVYAGDCNGGSCNSRGLVANYWSASVYAPSPTSSWTRYLYYGNASVNRSSSAPAYAFSVRCLKD